MGTGTGFLALLFAEMGHEVTGIDLSEGMLEKAKHNADNMGIEIDLFHGDAENLPFEDCSFDLVVNKYLLWALEEPSRAVCEWKRVLKPGGMIFSIDGNWFDSRPDRYIKRMLSELVESFENKKQYNRIFKNSYAPIRNFLPLYEKINPESISLLFSETGLVNTAINSLLEVQKFQRNKYPFSQRLLEKKNGRTGWKEQDGFLTNLKKLRKKDVKAFKFLRRKTDPNRSYLAGKVY